MMSAAYNYPANITLDDGWDVYGDISYLLWYPRQEGMDLAATGRSYDSDSFWAPSVENGSIVFQDTNYTSGFRIGVGANLNVDDWAVDLEYTYLRQNTETSSGSATGLAPGVSDVPLFNLSGWFCLTNYGSGATAPSFNSKWTLGLDWLDLMFKRSSYQGRRLVVESSAGLRTSWIRQKLSVFAPSLSDLEDGSTVNANSANYSNSWAIGPRGLVSGHWLIGQGFRFQGNMGGSLLFTQFTGVTHREPTLYDGSTPLGAIGFGIKNYNTLRPMVEANLGIGWGRYFFQKQYHIDFSATYDFNYLWAQNMMRYIIGVNRQSGSLGYAGDLVLHGLDIKARFDF
jgi:hypothetical protein